MNYILSLLGLGATPPRDRQYGPHLSTAICRGWSRPDPAIRLRQANNSVIRIFGFPEPNEIPPGLSVTFPGFGNCGPPLLYLRGRVPAYVEYIMGHSWQLTLRDEYEPTAGFAPTTDKVILRADELQRDQRDHCLRMRRCGAVGIRSNADINFIETNGPINPEQLFGWPTDGGVWILRSYDGDGPMDDNSIGIGGNLDFTAADEISERFCMAAEDLKRQYDMKGVCRVIRQAGGQFYANIGDCPEAVNLALSE